MAYTVMLDGVPVLCETVAEVIALTKHAGGDGHGPKPHSKPAGETAQNGSALGRWTEQRMRDFFKAIKAQQRKLIDALLDHADGRTDDQLCQVLGLSDGRSLAGVFTGVFKNARKVGADPRDVYVRNAVTIGDKRQFEYTLTEPFRTAAKRWKP
jgi:hypothetical protein